MLIQADVYGGSHITNVIREAIALSVEYTAMPRARRVFLPSHRCVTLHNFSLKYDGSDTVKVSFDYHDVAVIVEPGVNPVVIEYIWRSEMDRRSGSFYLSDQAQLPTSIQEELRQALQDRVNELTQSLETLDYSNLDELIQLFEDLANPSEYPGVSLDHQHIENVFAMHGFVANDNTGSDFNVNNRESVARFLIGQTLDWIHEFHIVYPSYREGVSQWRDKFAPVSNSC